MSELWTWLNTPPTYDQVLQPFGALYLIVFAVGFGGSAWLSGDGATRIGRNPAHIAGLRHWSQVGLWIFGPGLFFFGVGALQINPLSFGEPIWLVGSVIALVIAGYRCLRWWQTVYPRELAAADSASRAVEWAANGAWSEPDGRTAGTIVTRSNAGGLLRE
ncbi:MAG: hypothetical protein U0031_01095 [Thermomicrobiales bacterium]